MASLLLERYLDKWHGNKPGFHLLKHQGTATFATPKQGPKRSAGAGMSRILELSAEKGGEVLHEFLELSNSDALEVVDAVKIMRLKRDRTALRSQHAADSVRRTLHLLRFRVVDDLLFVEPTLNVLP